VGIRTINGGHTFYPVSRFGRGIQRNAPGNQLIMVISFLKFIRLLTFIKGRLPNNIAQVKCLKHQMHEPDCGPNQANRRSPMNLVK
jgi:hypothetical protein